MSETNRADVLAVGAHPDDVELWVGGIVHRAACAGRSVAIVDLTRGELASRGTPEEREHEARAAADLLGVETRINLGFKDGAITNDESSRLELVRVVRQLRPRLVLAPDSRERHPDHEHAALLVRDACYLSGLAKLGTGTEPHRPSAVLRYFDFLVHRMPEIVIDVSESFEAKMEAVRAFKSQFYNPDYEAPETYLSRPALYEELEARARFFGSLMGVRYGEPLLSDLPVPTSEVALLTAGESR